MDIIELLTQFNLTRQEAIIYITLLAEGELTGYEAAKLTGISRSNTYTSLAGLVDKGAAYIIEGTATRYTPVTVEDFCQNRIRAMQEIKEQLLHAIPQKREDAEGYITIRGKSHIINKLKNMIREARERIYISVPEDMLHYLLEDIEESIARGLKTVLITNEAVKLQGATVYHTQVENHQIRLIADSTDVLTGDLADGENSTCLFSKKKNLVDLFKDSLKNEIKLIEIINERKDDQ